MILGHGVASAFGSAIMNKTEGGGTEMRIYYRQPKRPQGRSGLGSIGAQECCFKMLMLENDKRSVTKKVHHHTDYEMHIVAAGNQIYDVAGEIVSLRDGEFLLIAPGVAHRSVETAPNSKKYAITFHIEAEILQTCFVGHMTERMWENIAFIEKEALAKKEISPVLIENCLLEILVTLLRMIGVAEQGLHEGEEENITLALSKQYIQDNIELAPTVDEVARYCHLSRKHLTRIFIAEEGIAPGEYIKNQRIRRMEKMLSDEMLSLGEISDMMHFSSEYYFNTFFKKYAGMPPGEYRKRAAKK